MEIPYKGYTITPSSERQPDGRWLPVAQLESVQQGIVTANPPIRADSLETRAARADADAVAVKLAKAWIDENEGKLPPDPAPVEATPPAARPARPPIAPEAKPPAPPTARPSAPPAARPSAPPATRPAALPAERRPAAARSEVPAVRPRPTGDRKRAAPAERPEWADLCQAVGLDADDKVDRLARVLMTHALLDRLVTLVLATKIAASREATDPPDAEKAAADIAPLPLAARIALGTALGVLAPEVAESVAEMDGLRQKLGLHRPRRAKPPWDVGDIEEIASPAACDRCVSRATRTAQELVAALRVRWPSPPQ